MLMPVFDVKKYNEFVAKQFHIICFQVVFESVALAIRSCQSSLVQRKTQAKYDSVKLGQAL